ncbi:transglutaminase-like domain-containing protein [uncultured Paludibaculum sp.]|uniref:transglutaminase-like domain-containing protein n=1 Tax=uncultured Paludibaculum sp. TaxID=1765020 RepID=UPI002AAB6125|nr:transglutaminase-like domain-containing protein [uncultured Paludibaculum sp.]
MEPSGAFRALLSGDEQAMELDAAALELSTLHTGYTDPAPALRQLDEWAGQIEEMLMPGAAGAHFLSAVNRVLFDGAGLRGDAEDYYAAENSCLPLVIERRKGLPITLSVIYLEVARRLSRPVYGVALPAHFVCQYNDGLVRVYVDVFDQGRLLTEDDCLEKLSELTARPGLRETVQFTPCEKRSIVARMLRNLWSSYRRAGDNARASQVEYWLRLVTP